MITGSPETDINGRSVCRLNDMATCPRHRGTFPIIGGCDMTIAIDGQPVAVDGALLSCGCRVMAGSQNLVFVDTARSSGSPVSYLSRAALPPIGQAEPLVAEFADSFKIELEDGAPAAGYRYEVVRRDGSLIEGVTDSQGMIPLQESDMEESVEIRLLGRDD